MALPTWACVKVKVAAVAPDIFTPAAIHWYFTTPMPSASVSVLVAVKTLPCVTVPPMVTAPATFTARVSDRSSCRAVVSR